MSGNTGRRIGTLFSDEADGPLDPEHKRMFMAMKREVLRLGGYACEFFVSQTPELTGMADRIIDLEGMTAQGAEAVLDCVPCERRVVAAKLPFAWSHRSALDGHLLSLSRSFQSGRSDMEVSLSST